MTRFTIIGTPQELLMKLEAIKAVADRRRDEGWKLFQFDEFWSYETRMDIRVCPICRGFEGIFPGEEIPTEFPDHKVWGTAHVKPGVHITYPHLKWSDDADSYGGCRCNIFWPDYLSVLTERLWSEMEMVV